jgi:hypothetical protein
MSSHEFRITSANDNLPSPLFNFTDTEVMIDSVSPPRVLPKTGSKIYVAAPMPTFTSIIAASTAMTEVRLVVEANKEYPRQTCIMVPPPVGQLMMVAPWLIPSAYRCYTMADPIKRDDGKWHATKLIRLYYHGPPSGLNYEITYDCTPVTVAAPSELSAAVAEMAASDLAKPTTLAPTWTPTPPIAIRIPAESTSLGKRPLATAERVPTVPFALPSAQPTSLATQSQPMVWTRPVQTQHMSLGEFDTVMPRGVVLLDSSRVPLRPEICANDPDAAMTKSLLEAVRRNPKPLVADSSAAARLLPSAYVSSMTNEFAAREKEWLDGATTHPPSNKAMAIYKTLLETARFAGLYINTGKQYDERYQRAFYVMAYVASQCVSWNFGKAIHLKWLLARAHTIDGDTSAVVYNDIYQAITTNMDEDEIAALPMLAPSDVAWIICHILTNNGSK